MDTDTFEGVDTIYFIINESKIKRLFWLSTCEKSLSGLAKYKFRVINKRTVIIKVDTDTFKEVDNIYFIINKSKIKRLFWLCFWENYNFSFGSVNL